jgi:hypothetical protein
MKHQNFMFDFILVGIVQWVVKYSSRRWQKFVNKNLHDFNRLVSKGKIVSENSFLIDSFTCLHFISLRPLGYFFIRRSSIVFFLLYILHSHPPLGGGGGV